MSLVNFGRIYKDAVGMFVSYLVGKFTKNQKELVMLDPAVGTGNLLFAMKKKSFSKSFYRHRQSWMMAM